MADSENASVSVPRHLLCEIVEDGCCPLHLRTQLTRALAGQAVSQQSKAEPSRPLALLDSLDGQCVLACTGFLALPDILSMRSTSTDLLDNAMQRPFEKDAGSHSVLMPATDSAAAVHNRIRVRLWLERVAEITAGSADETVFESRVRSFVDRSMRNRLEAEVAMAKSSMEEEVHTAKLNMLQCVQAISEEVDRRVRENVAALQEEFDRRAQEQDRALWEMVEDRVTKQTAAMKAEVDRRTDCVRDALELRAKAQEEVASMLQLEVSSIRSALDQQVREQEATVMQQTSEMNSLRANFTEVALSREMLEAKVAMQEAAVEHLMQQLQACQASCEGAMPKSKPISQGSGPCWAWISCIK